MALVIVFLQLTPVSVSAQAPSGGATAAASGPAPKTAWGHPDVQGIWLDEFTTPFERSEANANKEFFTDQERAEQDARRAGNEGRNRRSEVGSRNDVAGAYNAVFTSAKPTGRRTSQVIDPPNGRIPALTPQFTAMNAERQRINQEFRLALLQATDTCKNQTQGCNGGTYGPPSPRFADVPPYFNTGRLNRHDGPEDQSLGDRCLGGGVPDFGGFTRIVQGPDTVSLTIDTGQGQGYQRVVYMSGTHPPKNIRLKYGDSRGRIEGNSLVVETTNFSPKFQIRGTWENLTLVERFTRVDADSLEYSVTYNDPTVWTRPWTAMAEMSLQPDVENRIYSEPRCHEGNYGLPALLVGARMDEQAFKEGKGPDPRTEDTASCSMNE
jgi:hypothetical protein